MRSAPIFLLLSGLAVSSLAAAKEVQPKGEGPSPLISTEGVAPKWNTKELKASAAKGDPQACFELGTRLLDGDDEIAVDLDQARALLETAAAGGVGDAQFRLGKIYHDARGVPRDYGKALEYYTAAARQGVPEAQHNIGSMLVSARGVKRDFVEGLAWLLLAEQAGAASEAPQKVRDVLANRPADLKAAELRAKALAADLPNATVRAVLRDPPAAKVPTLSPPPPVAPEIVKPVIERTLPLPPIDPARPPVIAMPLDPPPPPSR